MAQQIRLVQEGFVRTIGHQLVQWTGRLNTTDSLESLFVLRKTILGETFERVASLTDFVTYPVNELKFFECKGENGEEQFSALAGDVLTINPEVSHWLQAGAPYDDCVFTLAGVNTTTGSNPKVKVGNYLQLDDYTFTDADVERWFLISGCATAAYNFPVQIVSILSGHTAQVAYAAGTVVSTNETGASWAKRRLMIDTGPVGLEERRFFPTWERNLPWELKRGGVPYGTGLNGETSREDPSLTVFRASRVTTLHATIDTALTLSANTRAAVALLQAAAEQNNTSFLGIHTTDYPA